MLAAEDVVEHEHFSASRRELRNGALQPQTIHYAGQFRIRGSKLLRREIGFFAFLSVLDRSFFQSFLAKAHQDDVHREAMQPRGEGGFAAKVWIIRKSCRKTSCVDPASAVLPIIRRHKW